MDPGRSDCQLGELERDGEGPSCGPSPTSVGGGIGVELPPVRGEPALRWMPDIASPPDGSRPPDGTSRAPLPPSKDDEDPLPPTMSRRLKSMSEAAAVPLAPTRHRHPKM